MVLRKRFFIGCVEIEDPKSKRRGYIAHLIDLKEGTFYPFSYRQEIGEIVGPLCSPGYAKSVRQECLDESQHGKVVELILPRESFSIDEEQDFAEALHGDFSEAVESSIALWMNIRNEPEDLLLQEEEQVFDDFFLDESEGELPEIRNEAFVDCFVEAKDLGQGPIFDFERDFTFDIEDVPNHLRRQYHILSFETASVAAIQFEQVKELIDHALEEFGAKKPTPKEYVPSGVRDCGCQDDALAFEDMSFMRPR